MSTTTGAPIRLGLFNRRRLPLLLAIVGGAVALGFCVSILRERAALRAAFPQASGRIRIVGLEAPVVVDRDARGVPHIRAESERDGFFALGFVHAQDRLGQMLWLKLLARGRSAEVIGADGLGWDRRARVIGIGQLADAQFERIPARARRVLEAYTAGINARIERVEGGKVGPPLSVRRLGIPLETWNPADSLAVFKAFAWGLGESVEASLVLRDLIQELGAVAAEPFFPRRASEGPPAPRATAWFGQGPAGRTRGRGALAPRRRVRTRCESLRCAMGLGGLAIGSSAWVVDGAHTDSGTPMLVADSHLAPSVPALLHLDHLSAGELDVAGTTLPGVPVFWTGRNRHVAWGAVHARAVVTDLFMETLDPNDPQRHHDGRRWRALAVREEILRVRGAEDEVLRVVSTGHGPLLSVAPDADPISVAWTGARIDGPSGIDSLLEVAHAKDSDALVDALRFHHEPVLSVVYADAEGRGGMQVAGWIPRRTLSPGLLPLPGRARWYDWAEPIPFDALPRARLGNGTGWIVAADAPVPTDLTREPIEWLWSSGERAARIEQVLATAVAAGPVELRTMSALQADVGGLRAPALIDHALSLLAREDVDDLTPEAAELAAILREWDGRSNADSAGAAAYNVFVSALTEALLEPRLGASLLQRYLALPQTEPAQVVFEILRGATASRLEDIVGDRRAIAERVRESLHRAWLEISFRLGANRDRWAWGRLHPLRFEPWVGQRRRLGERTVIGPFSVGGGRNTINAAGFDPSAPYAVRTASTARFAVDTGALDQVLVANVPGQSEHLAHSNHRDGIPDWLEGRSSLLATGRLLVEEASLARLVLEPVR